MDVVQALVLSASRIYPKVVDIGHLLGPCCEEDEMVESVDVRGLREDFCHPHDKENRTPRTSPWNTHNVCSTSLLCTSQCDVPSTLHDVHIHIDLTIPFKMFSKTALTPPYIKIWCPTKTILTLQCSCCCDTDAC